MGLFAETEGKTSYSRVTGGIIIIVWLGIATVQAVKGNPPVDIPLGWASIVAGLYGLNKLSGAFSGKAKQ